MRPLSEIRKELQSLFEVGGFWSELKTDKDIHLAMKVRAHVRTTFRTSKDRLGIKAEFEDFVTVAIWNSKPQIVKLLKKYNRLHLTL